jgi:TRAP-type transport system periplasmic protein
VRSRSGSAFPALIFQRSLGVVAALVLIHLGASGAAQAQIQPKFPTSGTADHPLYAGIKKFAETVKANTAGRVNFAIYPGLQLGGEVEVTEKIKLGAIEAGSVTSSVFSSWVPDIDLIDLPFIFRSHDQALASYPVLREKFAPKFEAQGFHLIGFTLSGPRDLISTFPIRSPDDVKGKKMRVLQNPLHIATWKLLGANPTPIPAPEIYNAMQTGLIDYFDFAKAYYYSFKFYEVGKHYTNLAHIYALNAWVVSNAYWRRLSPADRQVIDQVGAAILPTIHQATLDYDEDALKKTLPFGVQVGTITDKEPWRQKMEPVWATYIGNNTERRSLIETITSIQP